MHAVRHLLAKRHLSVLVCAVTLLLKLLIPPGYMINNDHGRIAITICSGVAPLAMTTDMPGMHGDMVDHGKSKDHDRAEMPCAFAGLSAAMTGAIDPLQLSALIVFILAVCLVAGSIPAPSRPAHLRPPLRGPPVYL
jgi:hypothetical protein